MPKTSKKHFDKDFKEKIWAIFRRESDNIRSFLTESEITILEKRLAVLHLLKQGKSLRETSEISGLTKRAVIAVKHGFKKPIPLSVKKTASLERHPKRFKTNSFPTYTLGDKFSRNLRGKR